MTILDSSGFAGLTLGYIFAGSNTAIVTTLSSLLGAIFYNSVSSRGVPHRLTRVQIAGIVVLFVGVIIVLNVQ